MVANYTRHEQVLKVSIVRGKRREKVTIVTKKEHSCSPEQATVNTLQTESLRLFRCDYAETHLFIISLHFLLKSNCFHWK